MKLKKEMVPEEENKKVLKLKSKDCCVCGSRATIKFLEDYFCSKCRSMIHEGWTE